MMYPCFGLREFSAGVWSALVSVTRNRQHSLAINRTYNECFFCEQATRSTATVLVHFGEHPKINALSMTHIFTIIGSEMHYLWWRIVIRKD